MFLFAADVPSKDAPGDHYEKHFVSRSWRLRLWIHSEESVRKISIPQQQPQRAGYFIARLEQFEIQWNVRQYSGNKRHRWLHECQARQRGKHPQQANSRQFAWRTWWTERVSFEQASIRFINEMTRREEHLLLIQDDKLFNHANIKINDSFSRQWILQKINFVSNSPADKLLIKVANRKIINKNGYWSGMGDKNSLTVPQATMKFFF